MKTFQEALLNNVIDANQDNRSGPKLTGEKNLDISKEELIEKVKSYNPVYLDVISTERNILEGRDLIIGRFDCTLKKVMFKIPDWDRFITAINAFYSVCWCTPSDEDIETDIEDCCF